MKYLASVGKDINQERLYKILDIDLATGRYYNEVYSIEGLKTLVDTEYCANFRIEQGYVMSDAPVLNVIFEKEIAKEIKYSYSLLDLIKELLLVNSVFVHENIYTNMSNIRVSNSSSFVGFSLFWKEEKKWISKAMIINDEDTGMSIDQTFEILVPQDAKVNTENLTFVQSQEHFGILYNKYKYIEGTLPLVREYNTAFAITPDLMAFIALLTQYCNARGKILQQLLNIKYEESFQEREYIIKAEPMALQVKFLDKFLNKASLMSTLEIVAQHFQRYKNYNNPVLNNLVYTDKEAVLSIITLMQNLVEFNEEALLQEYNNNKLYKSLYALELMSLRLSVYNNLWLKQPNIKEIDYNRSAHIKFKIRGEI